MFYRLVSQVCIRQWAYVIVRLESLRVVGQGPDFVPVCMQHINKIYTPPRAGRHDE
jgi:hypothetical protein